MIAVIDYGIGNLGSVVKALEYLDSEVELTDDAEIIDRADGVILPGVGSFGEGMNNLHERDLIGVIDEIVASGKPLLGICLGLQLFMSNSEEAPGVSGLGLIEGTVKRFDPEKIKKIPHIGWNQVKIQKEDSLFLDLNDNSNFYFVHSYFIKSIKNDIILGQTEYGGINFISAVSQNNIWGIQCHPEKSGQVGLKVLKNFSEVVNKWR